MTSLVPVFSVTCVVKPLVYMQSKTKKKEVRKMLADCGIHTPTLIRFIQESMEAHQKVQEISGQNPELDFKVIQAEMFINTVRS
jgi:hypothetical protein